MTGAQLRTTSLERELPVYQTLADHQRTEVAWKHHATLVELQRWSEIFAVEFKLDLPPVALAVGPTRSRCYGYFRPCHNQFGLRREILLHERHLFDRLQQGEFWRVLGTLLHELLHAWQDLNGTPGKRNHHNREFCAKAAAYGLIVDRRGITDYAQASPFFDLLVKHGVEIPAVPPPIHREPGKSKLKKWSCGCTNVRVAIADFQAVCLKCNQRFTLRP